MQIYDHSLNPADLTYSQEVQAEMSTKMQVSCLNWSVHLRLYVDDRSNTKPVPHSW